MEYTECKFYSKFNHCIHSAAPAPFKSACIGQEACDCWEDDISNRELNPEALTDMYVALTEADIVICELCKRLNPQHASSPDYEGCERCQDRDKRLKALADAEEK